MSIPWTKIIGGVVSVAGIIAGGAFGKRLLSRVQGLEGTILAVTDKVAYQSDRLAEALPWERQLRMMDALITDCSKVKGQANADCVSAQEKLKGQVERMSRMLGTTQVPPGEWEVSAWIEHPRGLPFELPLTAIVDVPLPNLAIVADSAALEASVAAELGAATSQAARAAPAVEIRRPVTDAEADSIVLAAASQAFTAIVSPFKERGRHVSPEYYRPEFSDLVPLSNSPAVRECIGRSSSDVVLRERCTLAATQKAFYQAFTVTATAYHRMVSVPSPDTSAAGTGSVYHLVRPYTPYGPRAHTIVAMDLAGLRALGRTADSLSITLAVHRNGRPNDLYPGTVRHTFKGATLVKSPSVRWRMDKTGVAWIGHGLVPREGTPPTSADLEQARKDMHALALEVSRKYSPQGKGPR